MDYNEFEKLYVAQLLLGNLINHLSENQLKISLLTSLNKEADEIGKLLKNTDAHWLKEPDSTKIAYAKYLHTLKW